jgi:transcriptional regulator with XRE-family HTH domain
MNIIGKNVKIIREKKGWTQEQLVAKCNLIDWRISRSTLAKIESKVRRVTDIEAEKLALALNITIEELFNI